MTVTFEPFVRFWRFNVCLEALRELYKPRQFVSRILPSCVKIASFVRKLWQISSSATWMPWNDTFGDVRSNHLNYPFWRACRMDDWPNRTGSQLGRAVPITWPYFRPRSRERIRLVASICVFKCLSRFVKHTLCTSSMVIKCELY